MKTTKNLGSKVIMFLLIGLYFMNSCDKESLSIEKDLTNQSLNETQFFKIPDSKVYKGKATHYNATGTGNCGDDLSNSAMIAAINNSQYGNADWCGCYVKVVGSNGKSVTVKIVDRCPECPSGNLDLSQGAFKKLADLKVGIVDISWQLVNPNFTAPIRYKYNSSSSTYYISVKILRHNTPISKVEFLKDGVYVAMKKENYGYFTLSTTHGSQCTFRVTDIYGKQLIDKINFGSNKIFDGAKNF